MAKLAELAEGYMDAAALLNIAIVDAEEELKKADGVDRLRLQDKVRNLRLTQREMRDLRHLCMTYYTANRDPRYTCSDM